MAERRGVKDKVVTLKMIVFWDVAPCSLVEISLVMKAVSSSRTLISLHDALSIPAAVTT
jgi:hypothetical protein